MDFIDHVVGVNGRLGMNAVRFEFLEDVTIPIILRRCRCPCGLIATPEDRNFGGSTGRERGFVVHALSPQNNRAMRRAWTETAYRGACIFTNNKIRSLLRGPQAVAADIRFGSLAAATSLTGSVRFAPESCRG